MNSGINCVGCKSCNSMYELLPESCETWDTCGYTETCLSGSGCNSGSSDLSNTAPDLCCPSPKLVCVVFKQFCCEDGHIKCLKKIAPSCQQIKVCASSETSPLESACQCSSSECGKGKYCFDGTCSANAKIDCFCSNGIAATGKCPSNNAQKCSSCTTKGYYLSSSSTCLYATSQTATNDFCLSLSTLQSNSMGLYKPTGYDQSGRPVYKLDSSTTSAYMFWNPSHSAWLIVSFFFFWSKNHYLYLESTSIQSLTLAFSAFPAVLLFILLTTFHRLNQLLRVVPMRISRMTYKNLILQRL